jgi:hypothetical protein
MDGQHTTPPVPPTNFLDMNELINQLFQKIERLETDVRDCHLRHIEATQFQNGALARTLERNTQVLERIEKHLKQKA